MKTKDLTEIYSKDSRTDLIIKNLKTDFPSLIQLKGLTGSSTSILAAAIFNKTSFLNIIILSDKESAAYFYNDLENIFDEKDANNNKKKVVFFPDSYKKPDDIIRNDNTNILLRTEVLKRISLSNRKSIIITYPEAVCEKVILKNYFKKNILQLHLNEDVSIDFITDLLMEYDFECVDFVIEPGQFALRGGIIDVFSFANENPFRIEFFGDKVESLRTFDPGSQLSIEQFNSISIIPNINNEYAETKKESFFSYIPKKSNLWFEDINFSSERINKKFEKAKNNVAEQDYEIDNINAQELFISENDFNKNITNFNIIEFGKHFYFNRNNTIINYNITPQPSFNKNFDILIQNLIDNKNKNIKNIIVSDNEKQIKRINDIIEDKTFEDKEEDIFLSTLNISLSKGFIDHDLRIACYTDHQIFERFHKYHLKDKFINKTAVTLKELYDLKPGDFVTHIEHGIGRFDGLEKINNNGKIQEAIRLVYKNNDLLYVNIHSLHRISKYVGKEGKVPVLNKLGSNAWNKLKNRTKNKVKDIAKDLIKLYSERKATKGFSYTPDTYMQNELEASFIYEDTPDQLKATKSIKKDMEAESPMDRLICGDVGFGKTEIAIRSAFKAVADSKQVAVLVPTTILALQHYNTFTNRLKDFPCNIDYINRFKKGKALKQSLENITSGKTDIIIGTHRLASKDIKFKDLGLLIIDEEQKFGVSTKEKLKQLKINVDTLTLTATPIPRTLQFSLMGARDLSIINTAPPNRYPVQTEIHTFNEDIISDAINYEISRGGQVFFVNNRIQNILKIQEMITRICPNVNTAVAHGQMEGVKLEKIMLDFIAGNYDVLIATSIIESGLDIPNANTIIINNAQNYGLSDLHQLRGRVGRMNKKAFCYLLSPPLSTLTDEARKRLKAVEEFSDLGSGFNIAMRDLDIRGAGNILGSEQSGFISDIGFEMYHKILDEAITELKETEFKNLYKDNILEETEFVKDCQIKTDMDILIPDDYVNNTTERLSLYKELDSVKDEDELIKFQEKLIDRFGEIPKQSLELIETIRLRWLAKKLGFEKIVLKNSKMTGYFINKPDSPYFQSEIFTGILQHLQKFPGKCKMKEENNILFLTFYKINNIKDAINALKSVKN